MLNDKERVEIAKKQYENLKVYDKIDLNNGRINLGRVSQVNNKTTGEQSFVITDSYVPPTALIGERNQVKELTVLYRGSTAPSIENVVNPLHKEHADVVTDWLHTNVPIAIQLLNGGAPVAMRQLQSSAETLKSAMAIYPKAKIYVYGHSLGSMNAQYALANLGKNEINRIEGGFFYQGPNIYSNLTVKQQETVNALNKWNKLFNYIDAKDLVPIGFGDGKSSVGHVINVNSKKVGLVDQHMWGGYQFDKNGTILTDKDGSIHLANYATNQQLSRIDLMRKRFMKSGEGLSSSEELFLDAAEGLAITQGMKQAIQGEIRELKQLYQTAIQQAEELWRSTLATAHGVGSHLVESEILNCLYNGGATEASIVLEPIREYEKSIAEATDIEQDYDVLLQQITEAIHSQLETDQELARQLGNM